MQSPFYSIWLAIFEGTTRKYSRAENQQVKNEMAFSRQILIRTQKRCLNSGSAKLSSLE
jgi:hypothetical protein